MGARKQMKKIRSVSAFEAAWMEDQRAWLGATRANLRPGGRAALMVGDGECGVDALQTTCEAAEAVGLRFLASATITPTDTNRRHKGRRRTEHAILLEAP